MGTGAKMASGALTLFPLVESGEHEKLLEYLNDENNVDLSIRNNEGKNPLDVAAILGGGEVAKVLVEKGAAVNLANKSGYTALHQCAAWGRLDCLKIMVSLGADNRLQTTRGETARDMAERYGKIECADFLSCVEASRQLSELIKSTRDTLGDPDKITGKWGKDDRGKVGGLCGEKADWLEHNPNATLESIEGQKKDFEERIQPYLDKLNQ